MRRRRPALVILAAVALLPLLALPISASGSAPPDPTPSLAQAFRDASDRHGVPESVLLALSYAQTRWDDHGAHPSTSGGYGPMHLTDVDARTTAETADGTQVFSSDAPSQHTLDTAAELIGRESLDLRLEPAANIAGGAALLASYQRSLGLPASTDPGQWYGAVALYSGSSEERVAGVFADDVYAVLARGEERTTNAGEPVTLPARADVVPDRGLLSRAGLRKSADDAAEVECPKALACEWLPAPYALRTRPPHPPGAYGNHDKGDRPNTGKVDYIIVHDTEGGWQGTLNLAQDPYWVSWQYTMRSADGKTWQHVKHKDVAWQAGNWYVNMHSIGIEHEGRAAQGATWYTEAMYRNSARLVRYLAHKHRVPLDRAHIIGHDQVPGTIPATVRGMHWDPGPYWDWEHYFELLGAPIKGDGRRPVKVGSIVTIKPGFDGNHQVMTGCNPDGTCTPQGSNFVYLRQAPDDAAPLVKDAGLRPDGSNSTRHVSDIGARAAAGYRFVVADHAGDWLAVWYLGAKGWFRNPDTSRDAFASHGLVVRPKRGLASVPVYGRAYPEPSAYPSEIPVQTVTPLQYSIGAGQAYPVGDLFIQTDYYRAAVFNGAPPNDRVQVVGKDRYYQIFFGHRMFYVRAADVDLAWVF